MLNGIRIVEIEGLGPGPFAGMMLADMGADVIVVHRAGGQQMASMPEQPILDRGKRSIELDLKSESDLSVAMEIIASSDALIEGFRPGVMERLGLGPEACHAANPALVYGRMTGWGQTGPLSKKAGHDMNYIGLSGALWYASPEGAAPIAPPTLVGDVGGGALYLVAGILAGIINARTTGQGTVVDAAIYDGSANMMNLLMTMGQTGSFTSTRGKSLLDGPHWSRTYRTADNGFMSVQCLEPKFYAIFLTKLGLADDPGFAAQYDPSTWQVSSDRLEEIFSGKTRAEWQEIFEGSDACVEAVLTPEESFHHPINQERRTWVKENGAFQAAPAPRFAGAGAWSAPKPPVRGEHTEVILKELRQKAESPA